MRLNYTSATRQPREVSGLAVPPLRICIASGTFHPESGGPPTYLLALGREFTRRGYQLRVVTYGDAPASRRVGVPGSADQVPGPPAACRYPYPVTRIPRAMPVASRLALFAREVLRAGRAADLLFVSDYGLPATVANLALDKPLVMKIVGDFAWEYAVRHGLVPRDEPLEHFQRRRHGPRVRALQRMQAGYARRADLIVTPSRYVAAYVAGWGVPPERVRVVRNAVADPTAGLDVDRRTARAELSIDPAADVILVVARLTAWKGVDTLIGAMSGLCARRPHALLVVVGDGPDRRRLEALAGALPPGTVRFDGEVDHQRVARHLIAADVLALCSGYEGLSHVLLEAMVSGVPVVASAIGGNLELVRDGHNGLLVPFGDIPATRAALLRLLQDRPFAARLAEAARIAGRQCTVERMVDETLGVFQAALDARARRRKHRPGTESTRLVWRKPGESARASAPLLSTERAGALDDQHCVGRA